MDIAGAKALKERLGQHGEEEAPAPSVDVSDDAPPVYHYLGVAEEPPTAFSDEAPRERGRSWLRRLMPAGRRGR